MAREIYENRTSHLEDIAFGRFKTGNVGAVHVNNNDLMTSSPHNLKIRIAFMHMHISTEILNTRIISIILTHLAYRANGNKL